MFDSQEEMEDIFHWCREGNAMQVRVWLDDTEHDMNEGDDHGFSPLHWAAKEGHLNLVAMLIQVHLVFHFVNWEPSAVNFVISDWCSAQNYRLIPFNYQGC